MYVAGAAEDVPRVTLFRVFVFDRGRSAAARLLLRARLATSAPNPTNRRPSAPNN